VVVRRKRFSASVAILALLSACGGGGSGGGGGDVIVNPPTTPPSPPPTSACTLRTRQDFAAAQINQNYLFPEDIAPNVNPASFSSVQAYIDALVAPARAKNRDRGFTYVTSIAEENALAQSGASAGFGVRLSTDANARRVFIAEAFEGAPALAAGIDRGTEIIAIGTSAGDLRTVDAIIASEGVGGVTNALGPSTAGTTRLLRVRGLDGTIRDVTVSKTVFSLDPVSDRYGSRIWTMAAARSATSTCAHSAFRAPSRTFVPPLLSSRRKVSPRSSSTCATMAAASSTLPSSSTTCSSTSHRGR
jgi:hypothetical protein